MPQEDFNYGATENHVDVTVLKTEDFPITDPQGGRFAVIDVLPFTKNNIEFDAKCLKAYHASLMSPIKELLDMTIKHDSSNKSKAEAILKKHAKLFDTERANRLIENIHKDIDPDTHAADTLTWVKFYGAFKDEASARFCIDEVSKKCNAHIFNITPLGEWKAVCPFVTESNGKRSVTYVGNDPLNKYFEGKSKRYKDYAEVKESTKDAGLDNVLQTTITEFDRQLKPSEWDEVTSKLECGEYVEGVINRPVDPVVYGLDNQAPTTSEFTPN